MNITPGPWSVSDLPGWSDTVVTEDGTKVAVASGSRQANNNAKLIAAAPDLLAALKALCDGASRPFGQDSCGRNKVWLLENAIVAAREAITKAGG